MFSPFFTQAAVSPGRQMAFRRAVIAHLCVLAGAAWMLLGLNHATFLPQVGHLLLVAGIVEGAVLIGWRLAQLPKSRALEFLLVSPLRPAQVLLSEAAVGMVRLGLVTLSGLPVLALLACAGRVDPLDLAPLLVMPFTWGAITGLGLTVWAYESRTVRRWGERTGVALVLGYLLVGVLAGENLKAWLDKLPAEVGHGLFVAFWSVHRYNPFGVIAFWLENDVASAWEQALGLEVGAVLLVGVLLARAGGRLKGHYHDRHYRPCLDRSRGRRGSIGNQPLSWWAVRRVTEYSGRINLWLAGGFCLLYASYTVAGPAWPSWLGRRVFAIVDQGGGIPVLAAALIVMAAVPAAFQYGLWDSSAQERCRRLELLLLTGLGARDYWNAAAAAAWRRGRGYFALALVLWLTAVLAGQMELAQMTAALAASVVLWGLYFTMGFRAFSRGMQANSLGLFLTLGLPLAALVLYRADWPALAALVPPGSVYGAGAELVGWTGLPGPVLAGGAALGMARLALANADVELRRWYDRHQGRKVLE